MKRILAVLLTTLMMLGAMCVSHAESEHEVLMIYSCPDSQIITNEDSSKDTTATVLYLYQDYTYTQYIIHDAQYEIYSAGTFELNFDWHEKGWEFMTPHIITVHVEKMHQNDHQLEDAELSYDVNLDKLTNYCLYPDDVLPDKHLVAAFMQTEKQLLVRVDGTEDYLSTMWFYYDDGTFQQYALYDDQEDVLFSTGDYALSGGSFQDAGAVLTLHRTQKYQDEVGLAAYDSTHDYEIGALDFIRIYPESLAE